MRVGTWNLQHGRPNPDGAPDVGPAVARLRALAVDVWAFQELDRDRRRSGRDDQPRRLADGLGGQLVWAPAVRRGGQYGVALVVGGVVLRSETVRLPGGGEPRVLVIAEVEVGGESWTVAGTHLSTQRAVATRQLLASFDELVRWSPPILLLGDLNLIAPEVLPWSTAEGYQLVDGPPTHSTRQPRATRRIDHVLLSGASAHRAQVVDLGASDHKAVLADVVAVT
ncbi:MAG: endonuclease/exonuclease/phosphatase family protein [Acidimicrobiales bacterium]